MVALSSTSRIPGGQTTRVSDPIRRLSLSAFRLLFMVSSTDCTCQKLVLVSDAKLVSTLIRPSTKLRTGEAVIVSALATELPPLVASFPIKLAEHRMPSSISADKVSSFTRSPLYSKIFPLVASPFRMLMQRDG